MLDQLQTQLYHIEQYADRLVTSQLTHLSFVSIAVIFLAGLLTSLTPCMLSMLPITVAYIGGYENQGRLAAFWQSTWFSLGLATTLAGLGLIAATLLAWVANTGDLSLGGGLLLSYTAGYVLPLIIVGSFTASLKSFLSLRQWSGWINPVSGVLLIGFGVFSLLSRLL